MQGVLEQGRADGTFHFSAPPRDAARFIISTLEGAMLIARPTASTERFEAAAASLLASLTWPSEGQP